MVPHAVVPQQVTAREVPKPPETRAEMSRKTGALGRMPDHCKPWHGHPAHVSMHCFSRGQVLLPRPSVDSLSICRDAPACRASSQNDPPRFRIPPRHPGSPHSQFPISNLKFRRQRTGASLKKYQYFMPDPINQARHPKSLLHGKRTLEALGIRGHMKKSLQNLRGKRVLPGPCPAGHRDMSLTLSCPNRPLRVKCQSHRRQERR